jgi:hypothetical protein
MRVITIGKRLVPADQIAFVDPFDPASNPEFKSDKAFKGRVVLLNRDTVLAETTPQEFAEAHGLRLLTDDNIAVNQAVAFQVETFTRTESFNPDKAYLTRLKWRDLDGNVHSKLLVTQPETVITELMRREAELAVSPTGSPRRPPRTRRGSRKIEAVRS